MAVSGEFERIAHYFKPLAKNFEGALQLEDDAALLSAPSGETLVATTDAMVDGVHYLPGEDPARLARKALRVNLSDLAAMGARPFVYLLTTALPNTVDDAWLGAFAEGLRQDQEHFGIHLAGGDSVSTPGPTMISITAIGAVPDGQAIRRSGARPGDRVWVSGAIGDGVLGLLAARERLTGLSASHADYLASRYRLPTPRTALGERLRGVATAAADVSDGLIGDLRHICAASEVGARIDADRVPLSPAASAAIAIDLGLRQHALAGGDDYELVFTAPADAGPALAEIALGLALPLTEIGEITAGNAVAMMGSDGVPVDLPGPWEHF